MTDRGMPRSKRATETFSYGEGGATVTVQAGDHFPPGHPVTMAWGQFFRDVPEDHESEPTRRTDAAKVDDPDPEVAELFDKLDAPTRALTPEQVDEQALRKAEEHAKYKLEESQKAFGQNVEPTPEQDSAIKIKQAEDESRHINYPIDDAKSDEDDELPAPPPPPARAEDNDKDDTKPMVVKKTTPARKGGLRG